VPFERIDPEQAREFIDDLLNGAFDFVFGKLADSDHYIFSGGTRAIVRHIFLAKGTNAAKKTCGCPYLPICRYTKKDKERPAPALAQDRPILKLPN